MSIGKCRQILPQELLQLFTIANLNSGCGLAVSHDIRRYQSIHGIEIPLIDGRYERGSILLTSNRAPNEWPELFGDPLLASAGLDRLLHHAEVMVITGSSFRAQGRQQLEQEVFIAQQPVVAS